MTVIYHIATTGNWAQAQRDGDYRVSTLDRTLAQEGFLHASTASQVEGVANAFYRGVDDLVLLVIDSQAVTSEVRYEQASNSPDPYPHIYGPLNLDAVIDVRPVRAGDNGVFSFSPADL
jgi:glutathione S-transferase